MHKEKANTLTNLSLMTNSPNRDQVIAFIHELKLVENGRDRVDFVRITFPNTARGDANIAIHRLHPSMPSMVRFPIAATAHENAMIVNDTAYGRKRFSC